MGLESESLAALVAGVGLGIVGFAPMLAVVVLARKGRIKPTVGKGLAALAVSFVFLMAGLSAAWVLAPGTILMTSAGFLGGFLAMWAALAAISMSH